MGKDKWRESKKNKKKIKDDLKIIKRIGDAYQFEINNNNWILVDRRYHKIDKRYNKIDI